jgi:two-component system sensor histidine kinase DesK
MHEPERPIVARSVHTTWVYTLGSIVFFFLMLQVSVVLTGVQLLEILPTAQTPLSTILIVLVAISAGVQLRWCWFLRAGLGGGLPGRLWSILLWTPSVLAWLLGLVVSGTALHAAFPLWLSVNVVAPLLTMRPRVTLYVAGAVITVAHPLLASAVFANPLMIEASPAYSLVIAYGALLPIMVLSGMWWWRIVVELDRHRRASAELAVAQERLRFASDLHDIQGHHLQVIALKAELAERLLDTNPDAARENIHETRVIARQALEETRSLVYGYRDVTLTTELENAREVLTASGAQCELDVVVLPDDPEVQRSLAMVVREATTNILRHSSATRAWIRLHANEDGTELLIGNDGADASGNTSGNGLVGLRERVSSVGGGLDVRTGDEAGVFELRVWIPPMEIGAVEAVV